MIDYMGKRVLDSALSRERIGQLRRVLQRHSSPLYYLTEIDQRQTFFEVSLIARYRLKSSPSWRTECASNFDLEQPYTGLAFSERWYDDNPTAPKHT